MVYRSMGEQIENNYVISIIKSKLPNSFNLKLEESRIGEWTADSLRKSINKFLLARERSEDSFDYSADNIDHTDLVQHEYSGEGLLSRDVKIKCMYCDKGHWSDECQKYKTLFERKAQLKGRCFVCLSDRHRFRECSSNKPCFHCKRRGNHHQSLCPEKFPNHHVHEHEGALITGTGDEISVKINDEVIMKSAQISIKNQVNGRECEANMLLDNGAKRTYITIEKAKGLWLKIGPPMVVRLNTFGATSPNHMNINETKLSIKQKDGTYRLIRAKVCKTITGPMKRQKLDVEMYKYIWKDLWLIE